MDRKYKLLDLFCGAGGCTKGYQRAGFYVVGIDNRPQPHYCGDEFYQADALEYVAEHGAEYDAIHASPPCQAYQMMNFVNFKRWGFVSPAPKLIEPTRKLLRESGKPFVIENVQGAPLETSIILCGASFGLSMARHRHFESNILLYALPCSHRGKEIFAIYGALRRRVVIKRVDGTPSSVAVSSIEDARRIMQIDWMDDGEIQEAIPPAYTEFIGKQLMQYLERG